MIDQTAGSPLSGDCIPQIEIEFDETYSDDADDSQRRVEKAYAACASKSPKHGPGNHFLRFHLRRVAA